ncbi:adenylate cyclase type 10-like isoform X2 [Microplitis mediator]|uniref:adenylate cyclase type 10-like isoform X2 n=1 Tax=Microplitis mediator TaxID=375433 RepID=UPI002552425D|nr:adenylate cyclase type 10-like isoform X2 [Microplitis mediator]
MTGKYFSNVREKRRISELLKIEKHTEIFASMCPDEILDHYNDYNIREYYTTLMLGDISGFTELTEKYTTSGKSGPSKLTETLNSYIGPIVQEILSHHGDVLKFSGDAFIVMWKLQEGMVMRDLATKAMQTACIVQKHFGTYITDIGVTLKVKLAIASGKICFTSIGDPQQMSHYIITGKPVWDVKHAETLCRGGDILVAPSSWQWANPSDYVFKILPDRHTLILASATMWDHSKDDYTDNVSSTSSINSDETNSTTTAVNDNIIYNDEDSAAVINFEDHIKNGGFKSTIDYSLRPKVVHVTKQHLKNELRSYMLKPVVRSVELDEPLEHIAEIRQVVIVFINVVTDSNIKKRTLIYIVNKAFKRVCGIVDKLQGCVNKVSLFDKDLMFLCIFGLRGGKQELEAQIGLRCASKLKRALSAIENIDSVTIGVSTGMTYCGVVGHTLRREYTVIGMPVNKAARLMVAYVNKVVCDRESFLYSRLESGHFILQEAKHLKGISNVGPIYEFLEQVQFQDSEMTAAIYPLLGRTSQLILFKSLFAEVQSNWNNQKIPLKNINNILLIRGEPRIGRTRLLDEISRIIPKNIACNYITLTDNDLETPYSLINFLFCTPLGFKAEMTKEDREKIIYRNLKSISEKQYFYLLNEIFNVNFEFNSRYSTLSDDDKKQRVDEYISKLVLECFKELWVILIDDAEYIDKESLTLIPTIVDQERIFLVFGLNDDEKKLFGILEKKSKVINLQGLDKWYHAGLVCQFLRVVAIPPELEKVIQEKSMGNPGWIENYLVSLMQVGGIEIKRVSREMLKKMGLVTPPLKMIKTKFSSDSDAEEIEKEEILTRKDGWRMYENSYEENVSILDEEKEATEEKGVCICTIRKNFQLEDVVAELATDVLFLKLFDSLKPMDQILLKCAAVLGETINRSLLEKLMERISIRDIALSVVNLFEKRILGCAAGDFTRSMGPRIFTKKLRNLYDNIKIKCGCTNVKIRESLSDLPKYASCTLLRFKISESRETTYRLLTENQKIEFHKKALRYLANNTKKCKSCGSKFFNKLLGSYHESLKSSSRKIDFDDILQLSSPYRIYKNFKNQKKHDNSRKWYYKFMKSSETDIIPQTYSNLNFTNCQCNLILITTYSQILDHCIGIDRKDKVLISMLEFASILLATYNVPKAKKLLNDADDILNRIFKARDDELVTVPFLKGRIKTLKAKCDLQIGQINEAENNLKEAIRSMGYWWPKSNSVIKLRTKFFFQQLKFMLSYKKNDLIDKFDDDATEYNDQLSKCLSELFTVFQIEGLYENAQLAAVWSLHSALESKKYLITLCTAFANMITIGHTFNNETFVTNIENDGIKFCDDKNSDLTEQELKSIVKLYSSIFCSRLLKNKVKKISDLGLIVFQLAKNVRSNEFKILILSHLIYLFIIEYRYEEINTLFKELKLIYKTTENESNRMLYYTICLSLQLETGIKLVTLKNCEEYYQEEGQIIVEPKDVGVKEKFYSSMWLWYLRMEEWESALIWNLRIRNLDSIKIITINESFTAVIQLECLLLSYVHNLDRQNIDAVQMILADIKKQFKILERITKVAKFILSRYILMKAYFSIIQSKFKTSMKLLQQSKNIARNTGNKLMYEWTNHCEKKFSGVID